MRDEMRPPRPRRRPLPTPSRCDARPLSRRHGSRTRQQLGSFTELFVAPASGCRSAVLRHQLLKVCGGDVAAA
jgi:hypothetical protein